MINRAEIAICSTKAFMSFSWNLRESVGKAAKEYETPTREREIPWILFESEMMEMEPGAILAAIATRKMRTMELMERVNVRGKEILTTLRMVSQSGRA